MSLKAVLLTVCMVLVQTRALELGCEDIRETNLAISNTYLIRTPGQTFYANQELTIEFEGRSSVYKSIIFQAKLVGSHTTIGSWVIDPPAKLLTCTEGNTSPDTVSLQYETTVSYVSAIWRAPAILSGDMEFHAIFVDADGYKHFQHSILMMATVPEDPIETTAAPEVEVDPPGQVPDVDMHNDRTEEEMHQLQLEKEQKQIEMEDLASEDEINRVEIEEEKRHEEEMHWEEMQYEIQMKKEDEDRQAQIRAEIRDREEFDRDQAEREAAEEERKRQEEERKRLEEEEELLEEDSNIVDINNDDIDDGGDPKDSGSPKTMATLSMIVLSLLLAVIR